MQLLRITIDNEKIGAITTLLQSGMILECEKGVAVGIFLSELPGFDMAYISDRIQTIFLDGNAVDDLETPMNSTTTVLALSAAMPGLAGAIFRRKSLYAALRNKKDNNISSTTTLEKIDVRLKLFNMIALEKGPDLLKKGGVFVGSALLDFFSNRQSLLEDIHSIYLGDKTVPANEVQNALISDQKYFVTIHSQL